jgi:hypothetical protein
VCHCPSSYVFVVEVEVEAAGLEVMIDVSMLVVKLDT